MTEGDFNTDKDFNAAYTRYYQTLLRACNKTYFHDGLGN